MIGKRKTRKYRSKNQEKLTHNMNNESMTVGIVNVQSK